MTLFIRECLRGGRICGEISHAKSKIPFTLATRGFVPMRVRGELRNGQLLAMGIGVRDNLIDCIPDFG